MCVSVCTQLWGTGDRYWLFGLGSSCLSLSCRFQLGYSCSSPCLHLGWHDLCLGQIVTCAFPCWGGPPAHLLLRRAVSTLWPPCLR